MAEIIIGIDLSGRRITPVLTDDVSFSDGETIVVRGYGNSYIKETVSSGAVTVTYHTETADGTLYQRASGGSGTNYPLDLPDDFGFVTEVNDSAVSYPYLTRQEHAKVYILTEDKALVELDDYLDVEQFVTILRKVAGLTLENDITVAQLRAALSAYYAGGTDVAISDGGTGASTAEAARTNLGAAAASHNHAASDVNSGTLDSARLPTVPIAKGGTGSTTAAGARSNLGITPANIGAAESSHTHDDRYYTETEVNTLLSGKANSSHTHDDRYYTETEVDTKLAGKAASSHNHAASAITSGTLDSARLPTVPIAKGGTGQTTGSAAVQALLAAGNTILSAYQYGTTLPANSQATAGRIFFKKV